MELSLLGFVLCTLAVWRVTYLLAKEDGPGRIFARLRGAAGDGFWRSLLGCFYCLSLWVACPVALALGETWQERALLWPALSAGAICLERLKPGPPPAPYFEDEEDDHVLRQGEKAGFAGTAIPGAAGALGIPDLDRAGRSGPGVGESGL